MLIALATAVLVAAGATASMALTPLREVVYSATFSRRENRVQEVFGGRRPDPYGANIDIRSSSGTVTVDVIAVADDGIGVRVTELFDGSGRPQSTNGIILPDGSLDIDQSHLNDVTIALLPFFGRKFMDDPKSMAAGSVWSRHLSGGGYDILTNYTVMKIDGQIMTVDEDKTIKSTGAMTQTATLSGDVDYKPGMLAPISGSIVERTASSGLDYNEDVTVTLTFRRLSDTYDH